MSADRDSVSVSLPSGLVSELDALVDQNVFGSRSDALRYGARLVIRDERLYGRSGSARAESKPPTEPLDDRLPDPDEGMESPL